MKGDFTRDTFHQTRHFYRVLLQQGRVQVDADWNEQIAILLDRFEKLVVDVFGDHGGAQDTCGFAVFRDKPGDLRLSKGRYYVDGVLCENNDIVKLEFPDRDEDDDGDDDDKPRAYIAFLDVYEKFVVAAQDPAIADAALGGLDTAARTKIHWTVKYWPIEGEAKVDEKPSHEHWNREWERVRFELARLDERRGRLRAATPTASGYTGPENQLYRVEIHQGGESFSNGGGATWKWSRENGSVAYGITDIPTTGSTGPYEVDLRSGAQGTAAFSQGDWVEIASDAHPEDAEAKPALIRVALPPTSGTSISLESSPGTYNAKAHPIVRRWDQQLDADGNDLGPTGGCLPLVENTWLPLQNGLKIYFHSPAGEKMHYRGGDYWLIPARTATHAIEWPSDGTESAALPPHGVRHRYAPLAGVAVHGDRLHPQHDYRILRPLTQL
jgi:hypothetical protein